MESGASHLPPSPAASTGSPSSMPPPPPPSPPIDPPSPPTELAPTPKGKGTSAAAPPAVSIPEFERLDHIDATLADFQGQDYDGAGSRSEPASIPPSAAVSRRGTLRRSKIEKHTATVLDPVTGKQVETCAAKYRPPSEVGRTGRKDYPPEYWDRYMEKFRATTLTLVGSLMAMFVILNGWLGLPYIVTILLSLCACLSWYRVSNSHWTAFKFEAEEETSKRIFRDDGADSRESVEWLNATIGRLWPQVNTDLFIPMIDMLEDVMMSLIPSIITQVKIANMGQGTTPMRILSIRWLDDCRMDTAWLDEEEQIGEWVSLEVAFAYHAAPSGGSVKSKAKNISLLCQFYVGIEGFMGTPMPVWVELKAVSGLCRVKLQLIPDAPFVKLATCTLMGMPKIEVACVPMNQRFFNVMNLPLVSDFVYSAIKETARKFVAPRSYTLDLAKLIMGDTSRKYLRAIGVLVVRIHSAKGVSAADLNGKSDTYCTLSYGKVGNPLWSTRIIFQELNPVWDETAVLLLNKDDVKAGEKLSVQLWDSDRFTADDSLGRTEVGVVDLVRSPGKLHEREDGLRGSKEQEKKGVLKWSVAYYGKRELNKAQATDGKDDSLPADLAHLDEAPDDGQAQSPAEHEVEFIPPEQEYPSGMLAIHIHEIIGLGCQNIKGTKKAGRTRGQSQATEEEEEGELPSAYCSVILEHQNIYRTRTNIGKPFFNTTTERFVRDWRKANLMVVVRDSRDREEDPIIGIVNLDLRDVFTKSSYVSRFFPLRNGIGWGKLRLSLLFRAIDTQLPRPLIGAEVGSVHIVSNLISNAGITDSKAKYADHITLHTPLMEHRASLSTEAGGWTLSSEGPLRVGVRERHATTLVMYFRHSSLLKRNNTVAVGLVRLKDIPDEENTEVEVPIYVVEDLKRFVQNGGHVEPHEAEHVGSTKIVLRFQRGLENSHRRAAKVDKPFADVVKAASHVGTLDNPAVEDRGRPFSPPPRSRSASAPVMGVGYDNGSPSSSAESLGTADGDEGSRKDSLKQRLRGKRQDLRELHRNERGLMQWKAARTLAWAGREVKAKGRGIRQSLSMEPRRPGVETEV